jgi:sialic acid synthase SpsE
MNKSYLYTETAYHHQGDMNFMKDLIDATKNSGALGIKFQVMTNTSDFISTKHKAYDDLNSYCFNLDKWKEIFSYSQTKGLDIIMMPLNIEAFKLLDKFTVKYLDIHSVSFYDNALLEKIKESKLDIILGVGGRTLEEIVDKKKYFGDKLKVLMVGFQAFPSKIEDVKIGKIAFLKTMFPELLIGYADHSAYNNEYAIKSNEYASILGATVFEKHITTTEGIERVDYASAISAQKIKEIIEKLNFLDEYVLTDFETSFSFKESEITYRERQMRCVSNLDLKENTFITKEMISLKLVDDQIDTFNRVEDLIGKKSKNAISEDAPIKVKDIS